MAGDPPPDPVALRLVHILTRNCMADKVGQRKYGRESPDKVQEGRSKSSQGYGDPLPFPGSALQNSRPLVLGPQSFRGALTEASWGR